jgi:hypothetical protein
MHPFDCMRQSVLCLSDRQMIPENLDEFILRQ